MKNDFGRRYRLLKAGDFSSVFAFRRSRNNAFFQIYWCNNTFGHSRVGLIVAKKIARKAHERNYIKRTIREWFRVNKQDLGGVDYIVRSKKKFEPTEQKDAILALCALFAKDRSCHG